MKKRLVSLLLTVAALCGLVPVAAAEEYTEITIPSQCELFVGENLRGDWSYNYFIPFKEYVPERSEDNDDGTTTYFYNLDGNCDSDVFNYRITSDDYITYAGKFTKTDGFSMTVTEEQLQTPDKSKTTVDYDTASNDGYNTGNIFLNINKRGHLKLSLGETYSLVPLRSWEIIDTTENNYIIEPDFHYAVQGDAVTVDENGVLTAQNPGTAIVMVTYDAINVNNFVGGPFFGAIQPENTGVFVVTVDGEESDEPEILDSEFDVVYFTGDNGFIETDSEAEVMSFPFDGEFVPVDGKIPLTHGRNIIKQGNEYQVVTAKKLDYTVNNGEAVHPGDALNIRFDTVYHPVGKLAGTYNATAAIVYNTPDGKTAGSEPTTYDFASNSGAQTVSKILTRTEGEEWGSKTVSYTAEAELIVPDDWDSETYTLTGGRIVAYGYGDPFGNHRNITYTDGKAPNDNYDMKEEFFGILPDIEIPVIPTDSMLTGIVAEAGTTEYFEGDRFDTDTLTVKAVYEDETTQRVQNYSVSPEIIGSDTTEIIITYKGFTATVPVTVLPLEAVSAEILTPPLKTSYTAGETFDPTGMTVSVTYNNGTSAVVTNYTYAPGRELTESDSEITVTVEGLDSVSVPITVTSPVQGGGSSDSMSVYFTLLGDKKHGESGGTHTLKSGNLITWIPRRTVSVSRGSTVLDVITKALSLSGIPYSNPTGLYIESIKGLEQFDNGAKSGWMYTVNGTHPQKGIETYSVRSGDEIVFHYSDDYSVERSGGGVSGSSSSKDKTQKTDKVPEEQPTPEPESWYSEAERFVTENGLMTGTETGFEPDLEMNRAMLVTVLYRLAAPGTVGGTLKYSDTSENEWYSSAVLWATKRGIMDGTGNNTFDPYGSITREQLVTVLYRYAKQTGRDVSTNFDLSVFEDKNEISGWAYEAFIWACADHIIKGTTLTTASPKACATRGQVAEIIMRFCE